MQFSNNTGLKATDSTALEHDRGPTAEPWEPLSDNDDDGGDHTTDVDPEI